jgi:hypothetical protein
LKVYLYNFLTRCKVYLKKGEKYSSGNNFI